MLLNNLKVQERQNRVCTTVAIAIVAETYVPQPRKLQLWNPRFTVLPKSFQTSDPSQPLTIDVWINTLDKPEIQTRKARVHYRGHRHRRRDVSSLNPDFEIRKSQR